MRYHARKGFATLYPFCLLVKTKKQDRSSSMLRVIIYLPPSAHKHIFSKEPLFARPSHLEPIAVGGFVPKVLASFFTSCWQAFGQIQFIVNQHFHVNTRKLRIP